MIQGINLIPRHRREARLYRRRVRHWAIGCGLYALVLLSGWAVGQLTWGGPDRAVAGELERVAEQIAAARQAIQGLQAPLAQARTTLAASESIGHQPDWSLLLRILADLLDEATVLTRCQVEPVVPPGALPGALPGAGAGGAARQYRLRLDGLGRSQSAVTGYVLRLEQAGLFERVTLIDTRTEPFMTSQAVGFRVECVLGGS